MRAMLCLLLLPAAVVFGEGLEPSTAQLDDLVALYETLHRNPELSLHESETASRLTSELEALGFEVTRSLGGHGFAAKLENGAGPNLMIRTDLDGLPVVEQTGRPDASTIRTTDDTGAEVGVMHACGHDVHMTSFIGTARALAAAKDRWSGTLVMIGQPAEELGTGARAMLDDGLFARFGVPDYAVALHASASLPTGKIGFTSGYAFANVDSVDVTIRGVGGHGAYPHTTKDPVVVAAYIVTALQTIVSRETNPLDSEVVTVGSIHGGTKHNVIGEEVKLQLTVRSYSDEVRDRVLASIRRISTDTARALGIPDDKLPAMEVLDGYTPSVYNDPDLVERLTSAWSTALGNDDVVAVPPVMAGEDFGLYGRTADDVPITIFWLGTVAPERIESGEALPSLHSPFFSPEPRGSIRTGVHAMTAAALELLGK